MQRSFKVISGQSVFDLLLNTYGTINLLGKLITDNNWTDLSTLTTTGQVIYYDDELIADYNLFDSIQQNNTKFRTGVAEEFRITDNNVILQTDDGQNRIV